MPARRNRTLVDFPKRAVAVFQQLTSLWPLPRTRSSFLLSYRGGARIQTIPLKIHHTHRSALVGEGSRRGVLGNGAETERPTLVHYRPSVGVPGTWLP